MVMGFIGPNDPCVAMRGMDVFASNCSVVDTRNRGSLNA